MKIQLLLPIFYYRNYGLIPFDFKLSAGEYFAGDIGSTVEFSRSFLMGLGLAHLQLLLMFLLSNLVKVVLIKEYFLISRYFGNFINYTWRPLTKDPGARLNRRNSLHDLLVRFRPIN